MRNKRISSNFLFNFLPYLFAYKPILAISRDPKLVTTKIPLKHLPVSWDLIFKLKNLTTHHDIQIIINAKRRTKEPGVLTNIFIYSGTPISRTSWYLEPNLFSLGCTSLKLYNFTRNLWNPRFLETLENSNRFFSCGTNWPLITRSCELFKTT